MHDRLRNGIGGAHDHKHRDGPPQRTFSMKARLHRPCDKRGGKRRHDSRNEHKQIRRHVDTDDDACRRGQRAQLRTAILQEDKRCGDEREREPCWRVIIERGEQAKRVGAAQMTTTALSAAAHRPATCHAPQATVAAEVIAIAYGASSQICLRSCKSLVASSKMSVDNHAMWPRTT